MPKHVVVCCDGTWNTPDELRDGVAEPTNVAKLALAVITGEGSGQVVFYEPGVGTTPDDRVLGGAFGYGLSANIRNAYRFLARTYEPGDDLYLFGFSRGAYTARSLAGLIRNCGILRPEHVDQVDEAFAFYRDRTSHTHPSSIASQLFRRMYAQDSDEIHFIGVWDTVGALGIPDRLPGWDRLAEVFTGWERLWGFHDTRLSSHVRHACHALAIDEQRTAFRPTLWTQDPAAVGQTLEQVWFAGVHSEVGGGSHGGAALSDIALTWMAQRAQSFGLLVDLARLEDPAPAGLGKAVAPDFAGAIADSRAGAWKAMHAYHRLRELPVTDAPGQSLASSAIRRADTHPEGYAPPGFGSYRAALPVTPVPESVAAPAIPA
jgi:uncharacterized protein (DUF2235 family)